MLKVYIWTSAVVRSFVGCMCKDSDNLYDRGDPGPNNAVIHYMKAVASGGVGSLHYKESVAGTHLLTTCASAVLVAWRMQAPGRRCDSTRTTLRNQTGALVLCGRDQIFLV